MMNFDGSDEEFWTHAVRVAHTERLILATVNVKSLKPKELSRSHKYGVDTNSTIDHVDRDMSLHGCHVVGVQESCIKGYVAREQQKFVAFTSGANGRGQLGVEAWVRRSGMMRTRVRTEPCSPRLLVLKIDGRNINLTVIVAHAPPNVSGEQGRKSFWSSVAKSRKGRTSCKTPGSPHRCEWTSGKSQEQIHVPVDVENANGSEFRRALEERNLFAVSTFTPVYQPTWWSGRAQHRGRRIDYVAVSSDWTDDTAKPTTLPAIRLPGESVETALMHGVGSSTTPLPVFLHCCPWHRGLVDEMYSVAHSALHRCATSCFGSHKLAPKPRKPWTSQRTVAMSEWTGPARHQLHRFRRVLKLVNVKCIMFAWRNAIGQIAPGRVLDALRERF